MTSASNLERKSFRKKSPVKVNKIRDEQVKVLKGASRATVDVFFHYLGEQGLLIKEVKHIRGNSELRIDQIKNC